MSPDTCKRSSRLLSLSRRRSSEVRMSSSPHGCGGQDDSSERSDASGQPPARHDSHSRGRRENVTSVARANPKHIPIATSRTMSTVRIAARRGSPKILKTPMSPNISGIQNWNSLRFVLMIRSPHQGSQDRHRAGPSAPALRRGGRRQNVMQPTSRITSPLIRPPNDFDVQRPASERKRGAGPLQRRVGQQLTIAPPQVLERRAWTARPPVPSCRAHAR